MAVVEIACICPVSSVVRSVVSMALICDAVSTPTCVVLSAWTSVVDRARMAVVLKVAICLVVSDETIDIVGLPLGCAVRTPNNLTIRMVTLPPQPCARLAQCSMVRDLTGLAAASCPGAVIAHLPQR